MVLCKNCKDKNFKRDLGVCYKCGAETSSGVIKICVKCARKENKCQFCQKPPELGVFIEILL